MKSLVLGLFGAALVPSWGQEEIEPLVYEAPFTRAAPTIDGVVSAGEWDDAPEAGDWPLLREASDTVSGHNDRFRIMWDDTAMYILYQSDYGNWSPGIGADELTIESLNTGIDFNADNFNIYLDPNTDGESPQRDQEGEAVDGYQIAVSNLAGDSYLKSGGKYSNATFFLEGHVNSAFGNQGGWQPPALAASEFSQKAGADGCVLEFALHWTDLNAADPDNEDLVDLEDNSLFHPFAPEKGDSWIANFSRITSDGGNFLPIWNWHTNGSFAPPPHGILTFTGNPDTIRFGELVNGSTYNGKVTITNISDTQTVTITSIDPVDGATDLYTVKSFPGSLAPGASGDIEVDFSPGDAAGLILATWNIVSDAVDEAVVPQLFARADVTNASGLTARYQLDETEGEVAADSSGVGVDAALSGVTLGADGLAGGTSASFSGGAAATITDAPRGKIPSGDFSISVFADIESVSASGFGTVFGQGNGGDVVYALLVSPDGTVNWFVNGEPVLASDAGAAALGEPHHLAATYEAATGATTLYVDGSAVASETGINLSLARDDSFFFGSFGGNLEMNGQLDDLQIYGRSITAEEVSFLAGNGGSPLPNLAGPAPAVEITWSEVDLDTTVDDLIGGSSITFVPFAYDGGNADGTFWTGDGGTTGDDLLDAVYNSHGWNGAGAIITLDGLTAGQDYMVQLLGAGDTRGCCNTRNQAASDGTNVSGDFPRGNSSVIGSFTANGPTQDIMIISGQDNGVDPGLSGFILTDGSGSLISAFNVGRTEGDDITVELAGGSGEGYANDFTYDDGTTDLGDGSIIASNDGTNSVQGGALQMTLAGTNSTASSFILPP
ncbi:MAG: LamG-like jellyroll fold domain-containing protein, partial [Verrucomicrobiota bacterium]